ncbi:hypothetical protein GCM10025860_23510 [Methanobacterium ferruginis]|nr:hypothetical protein GCM10025860_23510 [Methanobacterium ferruginis]
MITNQLNKILKTQTGIVKTQTGIIKNLPDKIVIQINIVHIELMFPKTGLK